MTSDTDDPQSPKELAEQERIAKWRAERVEVAEAERKKRLAEAEASKQERLRQAEIDKQARIAARQEERARDLQEKAETQKAEARALLPNDEQIKHARKQILRRIRLRRIWLFLNLAIWVLIPTIFAGYYATSVAVPLFEARSVVAVSKVGSDGSEGLGGLLGTAGGSGQLKEAYMAHEYVQSQALMDRLESQLGLVSTYSSEEIDPVQRLRSVPVFRISPRSHFDRFVESSVDIQTGLMHLYVRAPSSESAVDHSNVVLNLIAAQINSLTEELFEARLAQAQGAVADAEEALQTSQSELTNLQIQSGEVDPRARIEGIFTTIAQLQAELVTLRSEIDRAEVAGQSAQFGPQRFADLESVLEQRILDQRALLVGNNGPSGVSLSQVLIDYEQALLEARIAEDSLAAALVALSEARKEAVLGRNEFQIVVPPTTATVAAIPNPTSVVLTTFLTMLAVFGVYQILFFRSGAL